MSEASPFWRGQRHRLGSRTNDWDEGGRAEAALAFLEGVREDDETASDVGLPEDITLLPVAVDADGSRAIFVLDRPDVLSERYWWVGEGIAPSSVPSRTCAAAPSTCSPACPEGDQLS